MYITQELTEKIRMVQIWSQLNLISLNAEKLTYLVYNES